MNSTRLRPETIERIVLWAALLEGHVWMSTTPSERAALDWARALIDTQASSSVAETRNRLLSVLTEQERTDIVHAVERMRRRCARSDELHDVEDRAYRRAEVLTVGVAAVVAALLLFTSTAMLIAAP